VGSLKDITWAQAMLSNKIFGEYIMLTYGLFSWADADSPHIYPKRRVKGNGTCREVK
jgi:hypothetical protein